MPATPITVALPDGSHRYCYSPSSVVRNHFTTGQELTAAEFIQSARIALNEASERVREKFGFSCSAAAESLDEIESWAGSLPPETPLTIHRI